MKDDIIQQIIDELGHKGLVFWMALIGALAEKYDGDAGKPIEVYLPEIRRNAKISPKNCRIFAEKLANICQFSAEFSENKCQIVYPMFLKKQQKYFHSVPQKGKFVANQLQIQEQLQTTSVCDSRARAHTRNINMSKKDQETGQRNELIIGVTSRLSAETIGTVSGWNPNLVRQEQWIKLCLENELDLNNEVQRYMNDVEAKGKNVKCPSAHFTNWLLSPYRKSKPNNGNGDRPAGSGHGSGQRVYTTADYEAYFAKKKKQNAEEKNVNPS